VEEAGVEGAIVDWLDAVWWVFQFGEESREDGDRRGFVYLLCSGQQGERRWPVHDAIQHIAIHYPRERS
jgi:hypothetical protein